MTMSLGELRLLDEAGSVAWVSEHDVLPDGTLEIPADLDGFYDSYLDVFRFRDHPLGDRIVHLKIKSTRFHADDQLFSGLAALETVTIAGLQGSLRGGCFAGCTRLRSVAVSSEQPFIVGSGCFGGCSALVAFSGAVKEVRANAFRGCGALRSFPFEMVEKIWHGAFSQCTELTKVKLEHPSGAKLLGRPFVGCLNLAEFYLGGTVRANDEIERLRTADTHPDAFQQSFLHCPKLKTFYLSSCRSVEVVKGLCRDNPVVDLYILTPAGQTPDFAYWKKQGDVLRPNYRREYCNARTNGDPSILRVLDLGLWPAKIAPPSGVRLDEEGRFVESYPEYQSTPRAWTFALSNARNEELPLLPGEMLNKIMREDHYAWPVDRASDD